MAKNNNIGFDNDIINKPIINSKCNVPQFVYIKGKKFGKLTPIRVVGVDKTKKYIWLFLCDCGNTHVVTGDVVTSGRCSSCGCVGKKHYQTHMRDTFYKKSICNECGNEYNKKVYVENKPETQGLCGRCSHRIRAREWAREKNGYVLDKTNKSGVIGVCYMQGAKSWRAYIKLNGKEIYLGQRKNFDEAVALRKAAELKYHGVVNG